MIIDAARQRGYCFGTVDKAGQVVANRYVSSGITIPTVTAPVPYLPLAYPGTPPAPSTTVPQPLRITATHSPAVFVRGDAGTLTLTINNPTDGATDGSTTTVTQSLPAGLTSTGASGTGWTCTGTTNLTCTRSDVLPAGGAFPPITVGVRVATTAAAVLTTAPKVTGRSGNVWVDNGADRISTATPVPGDVGATVPATLALTVGQAAFGAFTPGVARDYTAAMSATVLTTAGDATLAITDPGAQPGHLVNGTFALAQPLRAAANNGAAVTVSGDPATLLTYTGPASNDPVAIAFTQTIGATEPLRTGPYGKTLVLTLATTNP